MVTTKKFREVLPAIVVVPDVLQVVAIVGTFAKPRQGDLEA